MANIFVIFQESPMAAKPVDERPMRILVCRYPIKRKISTAQKPGRQYLNQGIKVTIASNGPTHPHVHLIHTEDITSVL